MATFTIHEAVLNLFTTNPELLGDYLQVSTIASLAETCQSFNQQFAAEAKQKNFWSLELLSKSRLLQDPDIRILHVYKPLVNDQQWPPNLHTLYIHDQEGEEEEEERKFQLPPNLQYLQISLLGWMQRTPGFIPMSVTRLMLYNKTSVPIVSKFHQSLERLMLPYDYDGSPVDLTGCTNLKYIALGFQFNGELQLTIPPSVEHLTTSYCFNRSVHDLNLHRTVNLKKLTLGMDFNQTIQAEYLPRTLTTLVLPPRFQKKLDNLPCHIQSLTVSRHYQYLSSIQKYVLNIY